jgi:hypothetical protein
VRDLDSGRALTLPFDPGTRPASGLEAAIWWPEYDVSAGGFPAAAQRASIGLTGIGPGLAVPTTSRDMGSVFQRVSLASTPGPVEGVWKIVIDGSSIPANQRRKVFFAAWLKP